MIQTDAWGSELASWTPLTVLLGIYTAITIALFAFGRGTFLGRIPDALYRLTGLPGWAAAAIGSSLFGLLVAGEGFYSDVAWHVALGRDKALFTAPHMSIIVGLNFMLWAAFLGIVFATEQRVETRIRLWGLRIPDSMIPLALLGITAVAGFPLDELWHREYGIDVTMWSPTHMLMILGASFSGLASWLILADAGVAPRDSRWARGLHVVAAWLVLMGLTSSQGEFDFGVPQFQQIFHPILVTIAAAFALVAIRIVHGRGWALGIVIGSLVFQRLPLLGEDGVDGGGPVATRAGGLYIASALVVELVGGLLGTDRRLRFAIVSGIGVATFGLGAEWLWNQGAHQPWTFNLLPDALLLCLLTGVGAAVVGAAFARNVAREATGAIPKAAVIIGGVAVVVGLALPMPRGSGDVTADIRLERTGNDQALVHVDLEPTDAASDARWFQTIAWQGGGLLLAEMEEVGDGSYVSDRPLPVDGRAKVLVRLHRGGEMMAAPVYFPADPEIDEPEIPATDRVVDFTGEREFLLRETTDGGWILSAIIYGLLALVAAAWVTAFAVVGSRVRKGPPTTTVTSRSEPAVR